MAHRLEYLVHLRDDQEDLAEADYPADGTYIAKVQPYQRKLFIYNLLVRIHFHFIIVMIRWTGLAPWESGSPFPGSLTSTFNPTPGRRAGLGDSEEVRRQLGEAPRAQLQLHGSAGTGLPRS